jgi:hypothetical protein
MITLEDCVALCGLTEEEVFAIAEHEHMPEIATLVGSARTSLAWDVSAPNSFCQ